MQQAFPSTCNKRHRTLQITARLADLVAYRSHVRRKINGSTAFLFEIEHRDRQSVSDPAEMGLLNYFKPSMAPKMPGLALGLSAFWAMLDHG